MSTDKSSHSSPVNTTTNTNTSNTNNNDNHYEKRRQFIHSMYNNHNSSKNGSKSNPKSSLLSSSSTDNAASDSFIRDSTSPLFKFIDDQNIKYNVPPLNPKLFKPQNQNRPSPKNKKKKMTKSKSFTVTPPNSPKNPNEFRPKSASFTIQSTKPVITIENIETEQKMDIKPTNIHQKTTIIPPKKMKKAATKQELQLVLDHYNMAQNKDIEEILMFHEPHVMEYRDKLYAEAKESGITFKSDNVARLKILGAVVEYTYMNIEPPNEYTKQTDRKHFKEVGAWTAKFAKDKGIIPPLTLIYSAWCHDIERFIPATKCEYLPEAVDKYRKQVIHGITSAKVATCLLKGGPVTKKEIDRVYQMVLHHDIPHPREDIVILGDKLICGASSDLMWELELLMDADSFAFFQSTIYLFILFKSKKNSPDWIWERVRNNVKRLRPYLRSKAVECIYKLPQDLQSKMSINSKELAHLCSESGQNTAIPSALPSRTVSPNVFDKNGQEIQENIDFLATDNIQQIHDLKINESNNSNTTVDSEHCELVDIKMNI